MKPKLFLIAGHSGKGTGANGIINEGEHSIKLRDAIYDKIFEFRPTALSKIIKDTDESALKDVVKDINSKSKEIDLCLDIHFNAFNGTARGTEVLIPAGATTVEQEFAKQILNATCSALNTVNRGVKSESSGQHSRLAMLSGLNCHSVLLEVCFCDNDKDVNCYLHQFDELVKNLALAIIRTATII